MAWLVAGAFPKVGVGTTPARGAVGGPEPLVEQPTPPARLPDLPCGCSAGGYLLPRKPARLLATRVQEAQQAVL